MTYLADDVLKQIAVNGRAYWNESKAMAEELIARRAKDKEAQLTATQPIKFPIQFP